VCYLSVRWSQGIHLFEGECHGRLHALIRGRVTWLSPCIDAQADINSVADDFEEELRRSREAQAASDLEFNRWEEGMAVARSEVRCRGGVPVGCVER
jgi:hypothetical protein